jgi:hypothetical protein
MFRFACFAFVFAGLCSAQIPRSGAVGKAPTPAPKDPGAVTIAPNPLEVQNKARIEGQVFSLAGAPLSGASVTLRPPLNQVGTLTSAETISSDEGKFVFEQVEPGSYSLSARRSGFVPTTVVGGQDSRSEIPVTVGRAERKTGVVFRLIPAGRISGRVTDDKGDPVPNPSVQLLLKFRSNGRAEVHRIRPEANVSADGTFTILDLPPGRYYVSAAERSTDRVHVTTYYPGVVEPAGALPIDVTGNSDVRIDIRLRNPRVVHIRGQMIDPLAKSIANGELMLMSTESVTNQDSRPTAGVKDGYFQFDAVLPGSYVLVGYSGSGQSYLTGQEAVHVGSADLDEVVVRILPAAAIKGTVKLEGDERFDPRILDRVSLIAADGPSAGTLSGRLGKDGTFAVQGIAPGSYRVQAVLGSKYYVKSMHLGAGDVTNQLLHFGPGGGGVLNIIASSKVGEVSGVLRNSESAPVPSGTVTLWSADRVVTAETNHDGSFDFPGLAPGEYKLFGWEYIESGLETVGEFRDKFSAKAVAFKLDEGSHVVFDVPMIRRDAIQAEAAKLP